MGGREKAREKIFGFRNVGLHSLKSEKQTILRAVIIIIIIIIINDAVFQLYIIFFYQTFCTCPLFIVHVIFNLKSA